MINTPLPSTEKTEGDLTHLLDNTRKGEEASRKLLIKEHEEMQTLPKRMIHALRRFETVMRERVWEWAKVLVIAAI